MLTGQQHGVVLDGRSDDVIAGVREPCNRQIIALGSAAGKDEFGCAASQQRCYRVPRALDRSTGLLPVMVDRRCVAKVLSEIWAHGFEHIRKNRSGGVIVEVNAGHSSILPALPQRLKRMRV